MPANFDGLSYIDYDVESAFTRDWSGFTRLSAAAFVSIGDKSQNRNILSKWVYPGDRSFVFLYSNNSAAFRAEVGYGTGGSSDAVNANTDPVVGQRYHVGFTYAASTAGGLKLYVDGVEDSASSPTTNAGWHNNDHPYTIGSQVGGSNTWNGDIGYACVWLGETLTPEEMRSLADGVHPYDIRPGSLPVLVRLIDANDVNYIGEDFWQGSVTGTLTDGSIIVPVGSMLGYMNDRITAAAGAVESGTLDLAVSSASSLSLTEDVSYDLFPADSVASVLTPDIGNNIRLDLAGSSAIVLDISSATTTVNETLDLAESTASTLDPSSTDIADVATAASAAFELWQNHESFTDHFDTLDNDRWAQVTAGSGIIGIGGSRLALSDPGVGHAAFVYLKTTFRTTEHQYVETMFRAVSPDNQNSIVLALVNDPFGIDTTSGGQGGLRVGAGIGNDGVLRLFYSVDGSTINYWDGTNNVWGADGVVEDAISPVLTGASADWYKVAVENDAANDRFRLMAWNRESSGGISDLEQGARMLALTDWVTWSTMAESVSKLHLCLGDPISGFHSGDVDVDWCYRGVHGAGIDESPTPGWVNAREKQGDYTLRRVLGYETKFLPEGRGTAAISKGGVGSWDENGHRKKTAVDDNGTLYLLMEGFDSNGVTSLGLATASDVDGPWSKDAGNPIIQNTDLPNGANYDQVTSPFLIKDGGASTPNERWKLLCAAQQSADSVHRIFLFTAPDPTGPWSLASGSGPDNSVLSESGTGWRKTGVADPVVFWSDQGREWRMFFSGFDTDNGWSVGFATSKDLISWNVRNSGNPVIQPDGSATSDWSNPSGNSIDVVDGSVFQKDRIVMIRNSDSVDAYGLSRIRSISGNTLELYHRIDGLSSSGTQRRVAEAVSGSITPHAFFVGEDGNFYLITTVFQPFIRTSHLLGNLETVGIWSSGSLLGPWTFHDLVHPVVPMHKWGADRSNENLKILLEPVDRPVTETLDLAVSNTVDLTVSGEVALAADIASASASVLVPSEQTVARRTADLATASVITLDPSGIDVSGAHEADIASAASSTLAIYESQATPIAQWLNQDPEDYIPAGGSRTYDIAAVARNGIERIAFTITPASGTYNGDAAHEVRVTDWAENPGTSTSWRSAWWSYWITVSADNFSQSTDYTIDATVYSKDGESRVMDSVTGHADPDSTTERYIAYLSTTGDDNTGAVDSPGSPFATIGAAAQAIVGAHSGNHLGHSEIRLNDGTYTLELSQWLGTTFTTTTGRLKITDNGGGWNAKIVDGVDRIDLAAGDVISFEDIWCEDTQGAQHFISQNAASDSHVAAIGCRLQGAGRLVTSPHPLFRTPPCRKYLERCHITDVYRPYGSGGGGHQNVVGNNIERTLDDVVQNGRCLYWNLCDDIGEVDNFQGEHADVWQSNFDIDNVIVGNNICTHLHYQSFFLFNDASDNEYNIGIGFFNNIFECDVLPEGEGAAHHFRGLMRHMIWFHNTFIAVVNDDSMRVDGQNGFDAHKFAYIGNYIQQFRSGNMETDGATYVDPNNPKQNRWEHNHYVVITGPDVITPDSVQGGSITTGTGALMSTDSDNADFARPAGSTLVGRVPRVIPFDADGVERPSPATVGAREPGHMLDIAEASASTLSPLGYIPGVDIAEASASVLDITEEKTFLGAPDLATAASSTIAPTGQVGATAEGTLDLAISDASSIAPVGFIPGIDLAVASASTLAIVEALTHLVTLDLASATATTLDSSTTATIDVSQDLAESSASVLVPSDVTTHTGTLDISSVAASVLDATAQFGAVEEGEPTLAVASASVLVPSDATTHKGTIDLASAAASVLAPAGTTPGFFGVTLDLAIAAASVLAPTRSVAFKGAGLSFRDARIAIEKFFYTEWQAGSFASVPIVYENVPFDTTDKTEYIALHILPTLGRRISLGSPAIRRLSGIVQVSVFSRLDTGLFSTLELADEASRFLVDSTTSHGSSGSIQFGTPSIERKTVESGWARIDLSVEFSRTKTV